MKAPQLPGGGNAWFVRRGTTWCYQVTPVFPAGWVLTALYVAAAVAVSLFFLGEEENAGLDDWIVWAALFAAMTILFLVTVLRMSVPAARTGKGRRRCS